MSVSPLKPPATPEWSFSTSDLTENSPVAIIEWDPNLRVRYWNPRAEQMFGWTQQEGVLSAGVRDTAIVGV